MFEDEGCRILHRPCSPQEGDTMEGGTETRSKMTLTGTHLEAVEWAENVRNLPPQDVWW